MIAAFQAVASMVFESGDGDVPLEGRGSVEQVGHLGGHARLYDREETQVGAGDSPRGAGLSPRHSSATILPRFSPTLPYPQPPGALYWGREVQACRDPAPSR